MSKRPRTPSDDVDDTGPDPSSTEDEDQATPPSLPHLPQDDARRKRQKLLTHIASQTCVDPSDQLRVDQLTFIPRSYQLELAELAKSGNVLVCLDTGSGKTLISVLLLQHMHSHPTPSPAEPHKVSFFLVNLVPLVHQQSSVIAGNSDLAVGKLYGELKDSVKGKGKLNVDNWRAEHWSALLQAHQVVVSTAQCFLDALIHGFIKMDDLNLIVFDEVHHALKNHPFFRIMKYYRLAKGEGQTRPKIFGMTASPIFTSTGRFEEASRFLQQTMDARIHTVSRRTLRDLEGVKTRPEEMVVEYEPYVTVLDDERGGVQYSMLSREMMDLFGAPAGLEADEGLNEATEAFEKEVRPKLEYTMRHLGPLGCDLLWHSTLLEYRSRARKWANIDKDKRALVSDAWIVDASMSRTASLANKPSESSQESTEDTVEPQNLGLGLAVAHLSTNTELNQRILLHMRNQPPLPDTLALDASNVSPKILRLVETLKCFEPDAADFCAIIFVERRQTATLLVELIKRVPALSFIHPEFLLGHDKGTATGGAPGMDWHDQVQVLNRFRRRKPTNLLVATSIAEEGLDIQAANLVLRFDLFNRHISFLQSRGRARAKGSRFILMAERGNRQHAQAILNAFKTEASRGKWLSNISEAGGEEEHWEVDWLSKLRIDEEADETMDSEVCIYEPKTGARLFPEDAPSLISHYAATLHSEYLKDAVLAYRTEVIPNGLSIPPSYQVILELPSTSAVRGIDSGVCRSKNNAKRMAAFKACEKLRELGELDDWLMPKLVGRVKVKGNGGGGVMNPHHKAWRGSGKPIHVPVKRRDGWARFVERADKEGEQGYWATLLPLQLFDEGCQPLVLMTKGGGLPETKLLQLLHGETRRMKDLKPQPLGKVHGLEEGVVERAMEFTKYVFGLIGRRDQHSKAEDGEPAVLIVPVKMGTGVTEVSSMAKVEFDLPSSLEMSPLGTSEQGIQDLSNRVLVRNHGYHSVSLYRFDSIRHDLTPNSSVPSADPPAAGETYLTQHLRKYTRSPTLHPDSELSLKLANSPLFQVTKVPKPLNLLSPPLSSLPPPPSPPRLIVPYFYALHPLPFSLLSSLLLLPSILTRFDQLLLAASCNHSLFPHAHINTDLTTEALTSPSAGSSFDYERLEFLGDTFLKLVATCHTFTTELGRTEAELHLANKGILTNVRLLKEAKRLGLGKYGLFGSSNFFPKRFGAPFKGEIGGQLTRPAEEKEEGGAVDTIREKTLPDIVEALIGAALLSTGTKGALSVCRVLHLIPDTILELSDFNDPLADLKLQSVAEGWENRTDTAGLTHLQELFSHTYRYPHLGLEAFTHPSLLASVLPSYQRLEFLGDAWLDFYIVQRIFSLHPDLSPGELTALKGLLASNATLSALGVKLGLHKYVASNSQVLVETINAYAEALEALQVEEGEQYWTNLPSTLVTPKALADVVEASFASIVVDSGFDQGVAQGVFDRIFAPFYDHYCRWEGVRVGEVKRLVEGVMGLMRRVALSGRKCLAMKVESNLIKKESEGMEIEVEKERGGESEGVEHEDGVGEMEVEEEQLVQALLTEIWVELKVHGRVVARLSALPKSPTHLSKALRVVEETSRLQQSFSSTCISSASVDDPTDTQDDDDEDESELKEVQHESREQGGLEKDMKEEKDETPNGDTDTLLNKLDEYEHLLRELCRVLGWKSVFQSPSSSPAKEERWSLAQLHELVLEGCNC